MKASLWLAGALLALAATAQPAWPQSQEALEAANRLVVRSGLAAQIEAMPKQIDEEFAQSRGKLPDEILDAIAAAAKESFRPAVLQQEVGRSLAGRMQLGEMQKVTAWLETDLGGRVTRAEEQAARSMTPRTMLAHAEQMKSRPPSQRRMAALAELAAVTKATEAAANVFEAIALGMMIGMDTAQPAQNRIGIAALKSRLRQSMPREKLTESLDAALPEIFSYTYRDVSDADLAAYLAFNRSELGSRYNDAVVAAFTEALAGASVRVGQLMDAAMKRKSA